MKKFYTNDNFTCHGDLMLLHHLSGVVQVLQVSLDEPELVLI